MIRLRSLILVTLLGQMLAAGMVASAVSSEHQTLTPLDGESAAPDFALPDVDGGIHRLSDYRGRVVIVNFWATWCPPCREEMPAMQRAWEVLQREDIIMLAIDVGEDEDTIFAFTADYPVTFPLLLDRNSDVIQQWPVRGLPTTFVVDPQGRLAYRAIGARQWDSQAILEKIRALKKAPLPTTRHAGPDLPTPTIVVDIKR
jgi:peroxiredoxin